MTMPDFRQMTPDQFAEWQQQPTTGQRVTEADVAASYASARELAGASPVAPGKPVQMPATRPAAEVWGKPTTFEFTCPSGAVCLLRKLGVEGLLAAGIIDQVSRLPGIAQEVIDKAEIKPPTAAASQDGLPSEDEVKVLILLLEKIVPMAVAEPQVHAVPANGERQVGFIYLDSIALDDQVAIMNEALKGVVQLDDFRQGS